MARSPIKGVVGKLVLSYAKTKPVIMTSPAPYDDRALLASAALGYGVVVSSGSNFLKASWSGPFSNALFGATATFYMIYQGTKNITFDLTYSGNTTAQNAGINTLISGVAGPAIDPCTAADPTVIAQHPYYRWRLRLGVYATTEFDESDVWVKVTFN